MKSDERRKKIIEYLESRSEPVSGSALAGIFNVTRQVIVQDMAVLRAGSSNIIATSQGYMMLPGRKLYTERVACSHTTFGELKDELMTFIECGCKVVDVIVEHPIYGELKGNLMLSNSNEVDEFLDAVKSGSAELLSRLTKGVHIHTIEAINKESIEKARDILKQKKILVE